MQCPAQPDCFWTQHHNGIFRTVNGGEKWTEATSAQPSNFGFAVAVHPTDADTAWFVPAVDEKHYPVSGQFVATRTRDGGISFEVLRNGLPQQHALDIVYRHALDVDARGQQLAMGSTTGSLWLSEDQGDSCRAISQYLLPIQAVQFVRKFLLLRMNPPWDCRT